MRRATCEPRPQDRYQALAAVHCCMPDETTAARYQEGKANTCCIHWQEARETKAQERAWERERENVDLY